MRDAFEEFTRVNEHRVRQEVAATGEQVKQELRFAIDALPVPMPEVK